MDLWLLKVRLWHLSFRIRLNSATDVTCLLR